jgi:hypothetical protein
MKKNKRRLIILTLIFGIGITTAWWYARCFGVFGVFGIAEASDSIGEYESIDPALRASIPKLASLLRVCPCSNKYRIVWKGQDPEDQRVAFRALLYNRKWKTLGYEYDVYSGISGKVYIVDEAAIRAVAEKGGTLEDFEGYDQGKNE